MDGSRSVFTHRQKLKGVYKIFSVNTVGDPQPKTKGLHRLKTDLGT